MTKQIILNNEPTTYYITEEGQLYNEKTGRWYQGSDSGGYLKYDLRWKDTKTAHMAHRLVAEYFIPNPDNLPIVNHKDGNKRNNNVNNLEWVSVSENNNHAYMIGLKEKTNGVSQRQKYVEDLPNEVWKRFEDTPFMISNKGRIRNEKTNNLLKGKITSKGYVEWCMSIEGVKKSYLAHRLIFKIFGNEELKEGYQINHKDGNKTNNNIDNLEQILSSENVQHSYYSVGHSNIKQVGKYDMSGKLLATYPSCAEAARQNEGCYSNLISKTCNGKQSNHHGFIWKYMEE